MKAHFALIPTALLIGSASAGAMAGGGKMIPDRLCEGRFGKAICIKDSRRAIIPMGDIMAKRPVTFEFWTKLDSKDSWNIMLSQAPKSGLHWEIFTAPGSGAVSLYVPQIPGSDGHTARAIADGQWHFVAFRIGEKGVEYYVDGKREIALDAPGKLVFDSSSLYVGAIANDSFRCNGAIDELRIIHGDHNLNGYVPSGPAKADNNTARIYHFDELVGVGTIADAITGEKTAMAKIEDDFMMPEGERFLDEVQDEQYFASTLHGDDKIEQESNMPAVTVKAKQVNVAAKQAKVQVMSLSGEWLMKGSEPSLHGYKPMTGGIKAGWFKEGMDRSDWDKVTVPTSVQTALIKLGKLADPNWDSNNYDELDKYGEPKSNFWSNRFTRVEQQEWWFARKFDVPKAWKGKPVRLYFDGIDYSGSVYLNGKSLGAHAGMFGGPTCDVTNIVHFDKSNELVVRVDRVPEHWNGIQKGSPGWGWHYGHLVSLGIWRDVTIQTVPWVEVTSPFVITKSIKGKKAVLQIEYYVDSHKAGITPVTVSGTISGANFEGKSVSFTNEAQALYGRVRYRTEVTVDDPALWWPVNYGKQNLYDLALSVDGKDSKVARFGIRTIEMRQTMGASAESDYRWQFVVNGLPMFIKGANWCWSDPMLECDPAKYEKLLELARRGGIQMFRAWGGGIIETDTFYDKCDEKGLMVYQEFPYCWGPPDFPATDPAVLDQQVSQVVKRNRNHPSLVMWGGGNENVGFDGNDEGLFLVGRRCRQFDPSRPYHRTDPWGGSAHNWGVFHSGLAMDTGYEGQPSVFYGEYGLPSMTNVSSFLKYLPAKTLKAWPPTQDNHGILMHMNQFSVRDPIKVLKYADYGPIKSWNNYIEYSQMAQGDWLRFAAEGQRAGSYTNKTGFWFYKFTDLFPGHSWAVVDFYGSPKISYYRAKQACLPRAAFASYKRLDVADGQPFEAVIHAANDTAETLKAASVTATIYGSDLRQAWVKTYAVKDLEPSRRDDLDNIKVSLDPDKNKPFVLSVTMTDPKGNLISDLWYWFNFQAKTEKVKELEQLGAWTYPEERAGETYQAYAEIPEAKLLSLPRTNLTVTTKLSGRKGYFTVKNTGDLPAFNVLIDDFPDTYKDFLDDNSFFLKPGEERKIGFELGDGSSVDKVKIRAWNADAVSAV